MSIYRSDVHRRVLVVTAAVIMIAAAPLVFAQNTGKPQNDTESADLPIDYQTAIETYVLDRPQDTSDHGITSDEGESFVGEKIVVYSPSSPTALEEGADRWKAEAFDPAGGPRGSGGGKEAGQGAVTQNFAVVNVVFAIVSIVVGAFVTLLILEALRSVQDQFR